MTFYTWDDVPATTISPLANRQMLNGEHMTLLRINLQPGGEVPIHQHPHEQISCLMSGSVEFNLNGEKRVLSVGDVVVVPGNLPHGVRGLETSVIVESFYPRRDDLMPKS
jgi:quercetin dioxygenase-like cupin family protein